MSHKTGTWLIGLISIGLVCLLGSSVPRQARAAPLEPVSTLPPRPGLPTATPTPLPTSTPAPVSPSLPLSKGYILLHVANHTAVTWSVVQWQDGLGDWHEVEGWQGELDALDNVQPERQWKVWGVAFENFGQGPFRWVVYSATGDVLGVSSNFDLPRAQSDWVAVEITVSP